MLAYENRTPDVTLTKLKHRERQTYPNRELKCLQRLYIEHSTVICTSYLRNRFHSQIV